MDELWQSQTMELYEVHPKNDLASIHQFRATFRENVEIVLDLLDAMRSETALIGDAHGVLFLTGISDALRAYVSCALNAPVCPPCVELGDGKHFG